MTTHAPATRNALAQAIRDLALAGAGDPKFKFYTAAKATLLGDIPIPEAQIAAVASGAVDFITVTQTGSYLADGTLALFELTDSDDNIVFEGTVSESGGSGDYQISSTNPAALAIFLGNSFNINDIVWNAPT